MAISAVDALTSQNASALPALRILLDTTAATATTATQTDLTTFATTLGQFLNRAGALALDSTLFGTTASSGGLFGTNGLFDFLLANSLGVRPQVFPVNRLEISLGPGSVTISPPGDLPPDTTDLGGIFFRRGADGTLFAQVRLNDLQFDITINPQVFSTSALAQRFQIGNGTGTPA